jgi:hypothetical protein
MNRKFIIFLKPVILWDKVVGEVNKRLKSKFSKNYVQSVYRGNLPSKRTKNILDKILPVYKRIIIQKSPLRVVRSGSKTVRHKKDKN